MPEQTKTQAPKYKQTHKPIVERAEPELASEPPVEMDELTSDIARQLAVPPPATPGSHPKPRFTPKQVNHLQRHVGNQATQRLLSVPGSARVQRRDDYNIPPSPAPTPSPEQVPSQSPGSQDPNAPLESEDFEGYLLKNDSAALENVLLGVIAHLGGDARLDAGNLQVYRQFQANVSQLGADIRASEMKKLEALATKTE